MRFITKTGMMRPLIILLFFLPIFTTGCGATDNNARSDYRSAYIDFLGTINEAGVDERGTEICSYYLYDIDKDKTPELLVEYGIYASEKHVWIYQYTEGEVQRIDMIPTVHSSLYAYPDGNGILECWTYGGGEEIYLNTLNDSKLTSEVLYSGSTIYENPDTGDFDTEFTHPQDVVPGAYILTSYAPDDIYTIEKYED